MNRNLSLAAMLAATLTVVSTQPLRLGKRVNLGPCTNPGIVFGPGFDGRTGMDSICISHGLRTLNLFM